MPRDSVTSLLVVAHSSPGAIECEWPFVFVRDAHHRIFVEKARNQFSLQTTFNFRNEIILILTWSLRETNPFSSA